ncbi:MAG: hypothetical protein AVDCRST_MAG28-2114, partial [uncultured Rubrobacteraceae bacterium]
WASRTSPLRRVSRRRSHGLGPTA